MPNAVYMHAQPICYKVNYYFCRSLIGMQKHAVKRETKAEMLMHIYIGS